MEKKLVPTHRYKTRVIFLDDDTEFLAELRDTVKSSKYELIFVDNLQDFNNLIADSCKIKADVPIIQEPIENELSDLSDSEAFRYNLSQFKDIINTEYKTQEVTVVVVDNNLAGLCGIDICAGLGDSAIERILLTGDCDYSKALNAMNEKKINCFIDKMPLFNRFADAEDELDKKLLRSIDIAVERYFIAKDSYNNKLLSKPQFKKLYKNIKKSHDVIEHYLVEKDTLLLITQTGQKLMLKCWLSEDFDYYYNAYYDESDILKTERLNQIRSEKKLPIGSTLVDSIRFEDLYYHIFEEQN